MEQSTESWLKLVKDELMLNEESFCDNNNIVNFYTRLPMWQVLEVLFVKSSLMLRSSLTPFQQ